MTDHDPTFCPLLGDCAQCHSFGVGYALGKAQAYAGVSQAATHGAIPHCGACRLAAGVADDEFQKREAALEGLSDSMRAMVERLLDHSSEWGYA